jgi:hypothetical protein
MLISQGVLLVISVTSAALAAAHSVSPWLRAGVAALVTAGIGLVAISGFAKAWDTKRKAATALSREARAFLSQFGRYKPPATGEGAAQTFFDRFSEIRDESELTHTTHG